MSNLILTGDITNNLEIRLGQAQAVAGALFGLFVILHLSNIAIAPLGPETFNQYQHTLRQLYQHPVIELLAVLGPLVIHAIAGVWLYLIRRAGTVRRARPLTQRLHTWAGVFLLLVITGHIIAVRGSSYFYGVFAGFEGVSFSLWYFPAYFYPYYFLLALAGFYHATNGLRHLAARRGIQVTRQVQHWATLIAALWICVSLMSLGGLLYDVDNQADHEFARLFGSLTGINPADPIR